MRTTTSMIAALLALSALPATATEERVDPTKMTCEAFVALPAAEQSRVLTWLDGYARAGKPATAVPVAIRRQVAILRAACSEAPKQALAQRVRATFTAGSKRTVRDPAKMTCAEFAKLDREIQSEVAYWLDGYNQGAEQGGLETAGTKSEGGIGAPLVALDRDIVPIANACREALEHPLWEKIKGKL